MLPLFLKYALLSFVIFLICTSNTLAFNQDSAVQHLTFSKDKSSNMLISYSVTKSIYLTIRVYSVGDQSLILLKQILFHAHKNPGQYTETWDGKDESGHYIEKWQITTTSEPVELPPEVSQEIEGIKAILPNVNAQPLNHYLHYPQKCGVFDLKFTNIVDGQQLNNNHQITLKAQNFYGYTKDIGVNLRIFIDSKIAYELSMPYNEVNELTFNAPINVSSLASGKHILRAIIYDYADHYGTASVEFIKE